MRLNPAAAAHAIERFPTHYALGFSVCRAQAKHWLAEGAATEAATLALASSLREVLGEWGAGRRKAPAVVASASLAAWLSEPETLACLRTIEAWSSSWLDRSAPAAPLADVREALLEFGLAAAASTFTSPYTVRRIYVDKLLLLLTGCGPAFDTRVRKTLTQLGFRGWTATQQPVPRRLGEAAFRRAIQVYTACARCMKTQAVEWESLMDPARYENPGVAAYVRHLLVELQSPGRIHDVLLFGGAGLEADGDPVGVGPIRGPQEPGTHERVVASEVRAMLMPAGDSPVSEQAGAYTTGSPTFKRFAVAMYKRGGTQREAMRRAAAELGVLLPASYVEHPGTHFARWRGQGFR